MFCPDEDEAFCVQKFLILLSENLAFPFGINVACVHACILCIWPNTDLYHQFAVAKYILSLGEPFFLNNNYVITALTCMMVIQLDAHKSVNTKIYLYE